MTEPNDVTTKRADDPDALALRNPIRRRELKSSTAPGLNHLSFDTADDPRCQTCGTPYSQWRNIHCEQAIEANASPKHEGPKRAD